MTLQSSAALVQRSNRSIHIGLRHGRPGVPRHRGSVPARRRILSLPGSIRERPAQDWSSYLWALAATIACTLATLPLAMRVDLINIVMVYMVGSAIAALWLGRWPSVLTAIANVIAFDYCFVPPRFSLYVADVSYLITFSAMLVVALIISNLVIAVREQTLAARARERRTATLYGITRDLAEAVDIASMTRATVRRIADELPCDALILLCNESQELDPTPIAASRSSHQPVDLRAAQWALSLGQREGLRARQRSGDTSVYVPLAGARETIGVLVAQHSSARPITDDQQRLLEAFAGQLASALQRVKLAEIANAARLAAEGAAMRNTLLASISHDLRTPLSAISGAGSIVAQCEFKLDGYRRATLGKLIEDKARDMSDLLSNVLDLVRLESDPTTLSRDWHNLQDLVGLAIARNESRLAGWELNTDIPDDLPMVSVDSTLFVQLLSNLLENATKYTQPGTRVTISALRDETVLRIVVQDNGPGWGSRNPERLFEKFSRGVVESSATGVGLGLSICRTIARLHGGEIRAASRPEGGARLEIDVPVPMEDARLEAAACEA